MRSSLFRNFIVVIVLAAVALAQSSTPEKRPPRLQIAITFDDLPAHGPLPPGVSRLDVAKKLIAALRDAHVAPVYGFVNGVDLVQHPADEEVLKAWREAGNPLGDHSWSHMNLNQHSLEEFEADIKRNQSLLTRLMKDEDWHWFRFPFLAEGDTPEKKAGIRKFLREQGYKVAAVTMSFGDYRWTDPYARCKAKGDEKAVALLESSFLKAAAEDISYYRGMSRALYGRDIPYVLLMHIGALDAEVMPKLLELYKSNGVEFITLPQAESDDSYRIDTDLNVVPATDSLEDLIAERHLQLPAHKGPEINFEAICR